MANDNERLLTAAMHALRSYQFGNGAPDLAQSVADEIDAALSAQPQSVAETAGPPALSDDRVREEFERWAYTKGWRNFTRDEHSGEYVVEGDLELRWIGWNAHASLARAGALSDEDIDNAWNAELRRRPFDRRRLCRRLAALASDTGAERPAAKLWPEVRTCKCPGCGCEFLPWVPVETDPAGPKGEVQ